MQRGGSWGTPRGAIPGRRGAVQQPGQGQGLPAMGLGEIGETTFPQTETRGMDPLAPAKPADRLHRLAMVAVLVMQHMFEEYTRNPRQRQSRRDLDPPLHPAVAAETQMGQPAAGRFASPRHRNCRQIRKPGRMDPLRRGLQERVGPGQAMRPHSAHPGGGVYRCRDSDAGGGALQQTTQRGTRTAAPPSVNPFCYRYRTVGIEKEFRMNTQDQSDRRVPPQAKQAASGTAEFDGQSRQSSAQGSHAGLRLRIVRWSQTGIHVRRTGEIRPGPRWPPPRRRSPDLLTCPWTGLRGRSPRPTRATG